MADRLSQELKSLQIDRSRKTGGGLNKWVVVAVLVVVAALIAGAVAFLPEKAGLSNLGAKPREVEAAMIVRQSSSADGVIILTAGGYIIPRHRIDLAPKISGRVMEISFEKGDFVHKGRILVRLDDQEIQAQLAQARANRLAAEARLKELLAGSRPQEIERARANLEQAEASLRTAQINLERAKHLNKTGVLSKQALDDAQNNYDVALAQAKAARENFELVRIGPRPEQIELARAQLAEAEAAIRWSETQLENTIIRAPIDGTILDRIVEKGEMVTTLSFGGRGARTGLGGMANLKDLEVELDINEADIPRVRMGQDCAVSPDSYPERKYKGTVREIAPEANRQKATIQVKVSILNPDEYLRPETNAKVNFLAERKEQTTEGRILVPKSAVLNTQGTASVFLIRDGRASRRPIKTGKELWGQVEVISGLAGGEQLIVRGLEGITDGERVTLKGP